MGRLGAADHEDDPPLCGRDTVPELESLDTEVPVVRDDRLVSGYVRMEQKSGLIGIYEKADPKHVWDDGTSWKAEHELFEPDYECIMPWLTNAFERMPVLAELGIKRTVHGAISLRAAIAVTGRNMSGLRLDFRGDVDFRARDRRKHAELE